MLNRDRIVNLNYCACVNQLMNQRPPYYKVNKDLKQERINSISAELLIMVDKDGGGKNEIKERN